METTNAAIGARCEEMYHVAVAINDLASKLISISNSKAAPLLCAIEEMAKGQARELEALAEHFQGSSIGYYEHQFGDSDASLIVSNLKKETSA